MTGSGEMKEFSVKDVRGQLHILVRKKLIIYLSHTICKKKLCGLKTILNILEGHTGKYYDQE